MIDTSTKRPLKVWNEGNVGPYTTVPYTQLEEVRAFLDSCGIKYEVDNIVMSLNGEPETINIDFEPTANAAKIQAILDSAR